MDNQNSKSPKNNKKGKLNKLMDKLPHLFSVNFDLPNEIFTEEDFGLGENRSSGTKVLNTYSKEDILKGLEKYEITKILNKRGYQDLIVYTDTSDVFVHRITITDKTLLRSHSDSPNSRKLPLQSDEFLIDMLVRRRDYQLNDFKTFIHSNSIKRQPEHNEHGNGDDSVENLGNVYEFMKNSLNFTMQLTMIEWMCMQNPSSHSFSPEKPQLPGQRFPGLGAGRNMVRMLTDLASSHGRDGLLNVPENFHNGLLYFTMHYCFINPIYQGKFMSFCNDLKESLLTKGLAAVSWAFALQLVKNRKTGKPVKWKPQEQLYPVTTRMKNYFHNQTYKSYVKHYFYHFSGQFYIDWEDPSVQESLAFAISSKMNANQANTFSNQNKLFYEELTHEFNSWFDPKELKHI